MIPGINPRSPWTKTLTLKKPMTFYADRMNDMTSRTELVGDKIQVSFSRGIGMWTAYYFMRDQTLSKAGHASEGPEFFKNWPKDWVSEVENPRKGPIASAAGLVDSAMGVVLEPLKGIGREVDRGFVRAVNNPGPLMILKFGNNGAKPVKKGLTGNQVRAYLEKAGDISQMMVWEQGKQTYPGQDAAAWLSYNNYLRTGKNPAGYSLTIGPRSTSHSTLDSAIRAGTQAARTGMHATFQVTKPGGEVVSFDRTGARVMRSNPESLEHLLERFRATGRLAFYHPRKGTISLSGGKHLPVKEAVKRMREILDKHAEAQNPAASAAQYRLAQAVLSGSSDAMPVDVARELVEKTPRGLRSEYMNNPIQQDMFMSGRQGHDADYDKSPFHKTLEKFGYRYTHTTPIHMKDGSIRAQHAYNNGKDHFVGVYKTRSGEWKWDAHTGGSGHSYGGSSAAYLEKYLKGRSMRKQNPADDSAAGFEKFHGFPSREIVEVEEEQHIHSNLVGLGTLNGVKIRCLEGEDYCLEFSDNVMLTANESFTQLYITGGDQKVSLKNLHMEEFEDKESVILGECWCISYTTEKTFDDEETIDYVHTFGPEDAQAKMPKNADLWNDAKPPHGDVFGTGELPTLRYDVRNRKLYLDGGTYYIDSPLVGVSAGIVD